MPIRAHCTICSDFFDNKTDVAAIHCGHTFHHLCLIQWFDTAPNRTCPQCRIQVGKRHIINKLFFDVALEEQSELDAESLQVGKLDLPCKSLYLLQVVPFRDQNGGSR
uniref:RING-type domain-containing protein n=1 Tax=Laticauda laticaudata TaxID=8630 RepID=A0A8C5T0E8_LATLA